MVSLPPGQSCRHLRRYLHDHALVSGQVDAEGGARTRPAVDIVKTVVLLDGAMHRGKTQAGPLAEGFGGEEGFEDPGQGLLVHTAAVITDSQEDIFAGRGGDMAGAIGGIVGIMHNYRQSVQLIGFMQPLFGLHHLVDILEGDDRPLNNIADGAVGLDTQTVPHAARGLHLHLFCYQGVQYRLGVGDQVVVAHQIGNDMPHRSAEIAWNQVNNFGSGRGEAQDAQTMIDENGGDACAGQKVIHVIVDLRQIGHLGLQFVVDRGQLLVGRLQFLVNRLHLLNGRFQFFAGGLKLLVGCLEIFLFGPQFVSQASNNQVGGCPRLRYAAGEEGLEGGKATG